MRRSMYADMVALALLLPLDPELRLPSDLGTPGSLSLQHCRRILETFEQYGEGYPTNCQALSDMYPLSHAASITLSHSSSSQYARDLFGRTILLLSRYTHIFPLAGLLLHAFEAITARLRLPLSSLTSEVFRKVNLSSRELSDVPVALILPLSWDILEKLSERSERGLEAQDLGIDVGELISSCTGP